jgi:hypothetical protein
VPREGRSNRGRPGFRARQMTLVTTRLDATVYGVADLAEWSRRRWQVATARAHLTTTMQLEVLRWKTGAGVLQALTTFALVDTLVRLVMGRSAIRQRLGVGRSSCVEARRWRGAPSPGRP